MQVGLSDRSSGWRSGTRGRGPGKLLHAAQWALCIVGAANQARNKREVRDPLPDLENGVMCFTARLCSHVILLPLPFRTHLLLCSAIAKPGVTVKVLGSCRYLYDDAIGTMVDIISLESQKIDRDLRHAVASRVSSSSQTPNIDRVAKVKRMTLSQVPNLESSPPVEMPEFDTQEPHNVK